MLKAVIACAVCALSVAGCDTMQRASGALFGAGNEQQPGGPALEAPLVPIGGSAVTGSVRFAPRGDGVTMMVQVNGLMPGRYRVLVHANGNCSSPNGFSAGPPWSPSNAPPLEPRLPSLNANTEGTGTLTVRLPGVPINQLSGRSVVVHDRLDGPFNAEPDVRNDRIACGVIGTLRTLF